MTDEELDLVKAAQGGDRTAFGRLVDRYKGRIHAAALAVTSDPEEARDLTQEAFVRALQNLPRLERPELFPAWVRGIAHTVNQDLRRRAARERKHLQAAAQERTMTTDAPELGLVEREAGAVEFGLLQDLVGALPENCRVALDLRFREGLSYAEIGDVMGVPASTVRGLLHRGTKALRQKLKPMLRRTRGE